MRTKTLVVQSFKSEAEEAIWWYKNRAAVEVDLLAAIRERKTVLLRDVMGAEAGEHREAG